MRRPRQPARLFGPAILLLAGSALASCEDEPSRDDAGSEIGAPPGSAEPTTATAIDPASLSALLPPEPGPFYPSEVRLDAQAPPNGGVLSDVDVCESCHASVVAAWRTSAHAFASFNNPVYRLSVDGFRKEAGRDESRFCAGCHDPALLVDGLMANEKIDTTDRRAKTGVSCRLCHGIVEASASGNGSYTLAAKDPQFPEPGDQEGIRRHVAAMTPPPLREDEMCASCHKAFLHEGTGHPHYLPGTDDVTPWAHSYYGGSSLARVGDSVRKQGCRDCHMRLEPAELGDASADGDGRVASHMFLGAHTYLAAMRGDAATQEKVAAFLEGVASIDVAVAALDEGPRGLPAETLALRPGARLYLDVVVRNQRVGHHFPGGTRDAQDTWIEVEVQDGEGRPVAEAGLRHRTDAEDPTAHRFRAELVDERGEALRAREVARFRAVAYDHTIGPREARMVRYAGVLPDDPARLDGLQVTARLVHRARPLELSAAACAIMTAKDIDACAAQPLTTIAETTVTFGGPPPAPDPTRAPTWRRLADHGMAAMADVQERIGTAETSLQAALDVLGADGPAAARAEVLALLGQVATQLGDTERALAYFDRSNDALAGQPALQNLRGRALALVWRFDEAIDPLTRAADAAPEDDGAQAQLALALGSTGHFERAFEVAQRGLASQPRHPDLLRVQALALQGLGAPDQVTTAAVSRSLDHRTPDMAPRVRAACRNVQAGCALERIPVHIHQLRPVRRRDLDHGG